MNARYNEAKKRHGLREFGRKALTVLLTISMVTMNTPLAYAVDAFGEAEEPQVVEQGTIGESEGADVEQESATQDAATAEEEPTEEPADNAKSDQGEEPEVEAEVADASQGVSGQSEASAEKLVEEPDEEPAAQDQEEPIVEVVDPASVVSQNEVDLALVFQQAYISYQGQAIGSPMTSLAIPAHAEFRFTATPDEGCVLSEVKAMLAGNETVLLPDEDGFYAIPADLVSAGITLLVSAQSDPFQQSVSSDAIDVARNEQSEFTYEDDDIKAKATLADPSVLPANVTFVVTPITRDSRSYNYDAYLQALNNNALANVEYNEENTLLYDVAFLAPKLDAEGNEIAGEWAEVQLESGQVTISLRFKNRQLSEEIGSTDSKNIEINHLPLVDSVRSSVDTTADATHISASDVLVETPVNQSANVGKEKVTLSLESLSVIGIHNLAQSQEDSQGQELLTQTVLSTVSHEALNAASVTESTNLADFLTSATFNAPQNSDGAYVVAPGSTYQFRLTFQEIYDDDRILQFPNGDVAMTYALPQGLDVANGQEGKFTIKLNYGGTTYNITDNSYSINDGVLTVRFNRAHADFQKLEASPNTRFSLEFDGKINEGVEKILFSDGVERDLEVDDANSVSSSKVATFNRQNDRVDYKVSIRSNGKSTNVKVKDVITANALTLDASSIKATSSTGAEVRLEGSTQGNGFSYTIPSMANGEVITLTYSAKVDASKISVQNSKYVTTGSNKVEVWSDGDPTHDTNTVNTTIDYTPTITKGDAQITAEDGNKKTMTWTIEANKDPKVSMAGTTITDTIASDSQSIMKYSGAGLHIVVKNSSGKTVRTDDVAWNKLTNKTDSTWTYTVPQTDAGKAYSYTITYTTDADFTGKTSITTVGNGVSTSGGASSSGAGQGTPVGGEVKVYKEVANVDIPNREITWRVSFNVPESGLSSAVVKDTYPQKYLNDKRHTEKVKNGSIEVQGLSQGETYSIEYGSYDATIRFYQNAQKTEEGLKAGSARTVVVVLKTEIDEEWLQAGKEGAENNTWFQRHANTVELLANGEPKTATTEAFAILPDVTKSGEYVGTVAVNGVELPVYKYSLIFSDVTSDNNVLEDKFDTDLLTRVTGYVAGNGGAVNSWDNGYVFGGNTYWQGNKGGMFGIIDTADGLEFSTDSSCMPHDPNSTTGYFDKYKLVYYLRVKDAAALEKIKQRAAASEDGTYKIRNSASYNGLDANDDVTYEYEGLKKEILTSDEDLKKTDEDIWADFRITLNGGAEVLNDGEPLTMTDTVENLSVDVNSIKAVPARGVSWDMSGNTVTYTIPDATKVVIEYRARVIMGDIGAVGETKHIKFSNVAQMKGYEDKVEKTAERSNKGEGAASVAEISLIKYEAGNMTHRLAGARFQLQNSSGKPVRNKNGDVVEFVSDENGKVTIRGDMEKLGWAIREGERYYLEEITAPKGYMLPDNKYSFQVSADGTTDYSQYIYHTGDTMTVKNYAGTDVRVQKKWADGNSRHDADTVEVALQQKLGSDGEWTNVIRQETKDGWVDTPSRTLTLNKSNDWMGVFNKLPLAVPVDLANVNGEDVAVTYRVVETKVNGKEPNKSKVTITGGMAEDTGTYVFEIANKVDTGDLAIQKVLDSDLAADASKEFTFTVTLSDTTIDGEYGDVTFSSGVGEAKLKGGQTAHVTGLPSGVRYTITEQNADGFVLTSSEGSVGAISTNEESRATFTNAREVGGLTLSKTILDKLESDANTTFEFVVELGGLSDAAQNRSYGAYEFKNGKTTVRLKADETITIGGLPVGATYTIVEKDAEGFELKSVINESGTITKDGVAAAFANAHKKGELSITKVVESPLSTDKEKAFVFTVTLSNKTISGTYGSMVFKNGVATVAVSDGQTKTATGLPVGVAYVVEETDASDYEVQKSGNAGTISATKSEAKFTNKRNTGELEVSKTVESARSSDANLDFHFTVTLDDPAVSGTYGNMTFQGGVATFTLKDGQSKKATGLPVGVGYEVREAEENNGQFTTEKSGDAGKISSKKTTASFKNTRTTGGLTVRKTVPNNKAQGKNATFGFTVELDDKTITGTYGEMSFIKGVATFELNDGGTKVATGLPTGIAYTVTEEEAEGYVPTPANRQATGAVDLGMAIADFVNTRVEKGDLVVSKTVQSPFESSKDDEFEFTVTLSNNTIGGDAGKTYGQMTFHNGVATFSLKDGETKRATGLPQGVTYVVTEKPSDAYRSESFGESGTISDGGTATAAFTNTRKTGDLQITKAVVSDAAADHSRAFTFTIELSDKAISGTFGNITFQEGMATVSLADGETKTAKGLPTGISYTVTEDEVDGFELDGQNGRTGSIAESKSVETFTNARKTGGLQVSKALVSQVRADEDQVFEFNIFITGLTEEAGNKTYSGVTLRDGKGTIRLKGGEKKQITGLPEGVSYVVVEQEHGDFVSTARNESGTIGGKTAKVAFENARKTGSLTIAKALTSGLAADADQEFAFTVTLTGLTDEAKDGTYGGVAFTGGKAKVTLKAGESKVIDGLPVGVAYTVTEADAEGFELKDKTGDTGTITAEGAVAAFTNARKTGKLELSKTLISNAAADANQEFAFTVTLAGLTDEAKDATFGGVKFTNGKAKVSLKGGESKVIDGLPLGITYKVTEAVAEGFELTGKAGETGTISAKKAVATFTNERKTGELVLSKELVSDAAADAEREFSFAVELLGLTDEAKGGTYGGVQFADGKATVTLKGGKSKVIDGLPLGIRYKVTEAESSGFELTKKTGDEGTISTTKSEAKFTNARQTGNLKIEKVLAEDADAAEDQEFTFTVTLSDAGIHKTYSGVEFTDGVATLTLKGGESKTIKGLPIGIGYTVTEDAADGFQLAGKTGDIGSISTTTSTATFTNKRDRGGLIVAKTLVSDAAADAGQKFVFTVTLGDTSINKTYGSMAFKDGVATFKLKGGDTAEASGLPTGITYTVTEAEVDGFELTSKTGDSGTIRKGKTQRAEFTNTRQTGDLKISKRLVSGATADADQPFTFTVALSDKTISKKYGDIEFVDGVATVTLKGGESATAEGLPIGVAYKVTEAASEGFELTKKTGEAGTISATKSEATFTNERKTGELVLSKELVSDAAADAEREFSFTVELLGLTDEAKGGTYGGVQFADGKATVTLKGGESKVIDGLPLNIAYKVTEEKAAGFELVGDAGSTGTISATKSQATFANARKTGDLELSKVLVTGAAADAEREFVFTVTLSDATIGGEAGKTFGDMTFTNGVATVSLKGGETATATGLPTGVTYTVTEAETEGFELTGKSGEQGTISTATSRASFTNARKTGDLELSKVLVTGAAADAEREFTFTIALSDTTIGGAAGQAFGDMTFTNGVATVSLKGGETATATGLPTGVTYKVTEADAEGFELTGKSGEQGTISTATSRATFTNTRKTGDLQVSKVVVSDAAADADQEFDFTVTLSDTTINGTYGSGQNAMTFQNGVATVSLKGGETATANGLPTGITYTVVEAQENDGSFTTSKSGEAGTISTTPSEAVFTNTRRTGNLEVSKTVPNPDAASANATFTFTVTLSDTTIGGKDGRAYGDMTFTNGVATFTLGNGQKATATGLPTGIGYTVEEAPADGYTTTPANGKTSGAISEGTTTAEFVNRRQELGDLTVSKTVESALEADHNKQFDFTVTLGDHTITGTYGGMTFTNGVASFKLRDGESRSATGLPNGTTYTVTEGAYDDFKTTKTGDTGTITDGGSANALFKNAKKTGALEVSKEVVSDAQADADRVFSFVVQLDPAVSGTFGAKDAQATFDAEGKTVVVLKGGESKTIDGLPYGVAYTVVEAQDDDFSATAKGDTGTIGKDTSKAAFKNTRKTGDLTVSKTVVSDAAADARQSFSFTIELTDKTIAGTYGDLTFDAGVATVELKGGESATATGLPTGIAYEVTEAASGDFIAESEGATGSISTSESVATFTNTRKTGDLSVTKSVTSSTPADKSKKFSFTVRLSDKKIGGKEGKDYGQMTFRNGVATFDLADGQTATATGLPTGIDYEVTEETADGFITTQSGDEGTISTIESKATFTNAKDEGGFMVSKSVVSPLASNKTQDFAFTVTLDDQTVSGTYGEMTFTNGVAHFSLADGQTKTATGLAKGLKYTVEEETYDDFETTSDGESGAISDVLSEAKFTNTRKTGDLTVSKAVVSDAAADASQTFTFTVELSNKTLAGTYGDLTFDAGKAIVTLRGGESATATGLPTGVTYRVTEVANEGFTTTQTGEQGTISQDASVATFTNTRKTGSLEVRKTVVSDAADDASQPFSFTVTLADKTISGTYGDLTFDAGVATVALKGGESATATGLPTGIAYEVTEAEVEGFTNTQKAGDQGVISTARSVASFTNTRKTGDLTVSKTVVSDAAADADQPFSFTVTLADKTISGTYGDLVFEGGKATVELKGGESATATGLPTGVAYEVTEAAVGDFTTQVKGGAGTISTKPSKAAFTNTRKTGDLTVSKVLVSDAKADKNQTFTFTVTLSDATIAGEYGGMTFNDGVATVELKGGESATATGLPTGIAFEVTEAASEGFVTTSTGETGTISTQAAQATFTNTRDRGGIIVSKSVVSDAAADAELEFEFTVSLSDTTINGTYGTGNTAMTFADGVASFKLKSGQTAVATDLPTGVAYTVEETAHDGFTTAATGATGTIKKNEASNASFTNTRKTGDLTVSKTVASDAAADAHQSFSFTIELADKTISGAYGDLTFDAGVATVELKGGESATATGLPVGVDYTVTEAEADGFLLTSKSGDEGTITTSGATASFTNTREVGDLTVSKAVVSDAAADASQSFTFTVTLADKTISGTYGRMTFEAGVATVALKGGESATATGLPSGVAYEVTEAVNGDFVTESQNATGTIAVQGVRASFTNTRKTGELVVSKSVKSSTAADHKKGFLFTVTLSDASIGGTYGQMGFRNGVATFALADGQTKKATNLPTGIAYTVEETPVAGFVTTKADETGTISTSQAQATFVNSRDEGGLLVSKSVVSPVASDKGKNFNFTVTLDNNTITGTYGSMTFNEGVATFALANGQTASATGLPQGIAYVVEEAADGDFEVVAQDSTGTIGKSVRQASFTNTRKTGDLTVSKDVVSDAAADASQLFAFRVELGDDSINGSFGGVTFANGIATVNLKGGESVTATGLPANVSYVVAEASKDGFTTVASGTVGTIAPKPSAASFTNTRKTGDLTVSKTVVSDAAADARQPFSFTVTLADKTIAGTYGDLTFDAGVAVVELKGGESATATGLPTGVAYEVIEAANGDFNTTATGATGIIAKDGNVASFTNTRKTGDLTVSKTVVSDAAADASQTFTFTVTLADKTISGTYGRMTFEAGKATVTLKGGESVTATGLPTGVAYEVTEAEANGFVTTSTGADGTITTTPARADFTNTRDRGGLIVSKTVVSDAAVDASQEFAFTVTLGDASIGGKDGKTYGNMTFKEGVATFVLRGGQTMMATDLPTGITYTVEEAQSDDFITEATGTTGAISKRRASVASFTNTRKTGDLTVSKTVVSDAAADARQPFSFTVTLADKTIAGTYGDLTFDAGVATVELKGGEFATATGLPVGVDYTVTEAEADGFQLSAKSGDKGTITTSGATAEFTNTREVGDLIVSKELVSKVEADAGLEFVLEVTLADATINGTYGELTFKDGVATASLKGGESATAAGLPTGVAYEVTETSRSSKGFEVQTQGNKGVITTRASVAVFTNTRLLGALKIQKQVSVDGKATETTAADGTYVFRVTGPGAYEQGIDHTITVANGRSQTITLNDLFVGDYTISEVTTNLPKNMRLLSQDSQTVTVEANNEQSVPVATFHNDIKSTEAKIEVTKQFNNWDGAKHNSFAFRLTPEGNAPMPANTLKPNEDVRTATSQNHTATFDGITFTREGTYAYKLREVVPEGASEHGVFEGITYDTAEHTVLVHVTADEDGELHTRTVYDAALPDLTITNTYAATGATTITGTKELAGRPFAKGDTWTFSITQPEGQDGPEPQHSKVTVDASASNAIDFGTVGDFTFEDVGKTFTYEVRESGSVQDVANDAQTKTVVLQIADNGDGTLNVINSAHDTETPLTFTNTYLVHQDLVAYKGIAGRKWHTNGRGEVAEEYSFELYDSDEASAQKRAECKVGNTATTHGAKHTAKFGTFTFTSEEVGNTYAYTVREVPATEEETQKGMTSDSTMYDVAFTVVEEDGEVKVRTSYKYGVDEDGNELAKDRLEFVNTYQAKQTKARIQARKVLKGRNMANEEFQFELYSVASDGTRYKQQTKSVKAAKDSEPSLVAFDSIDCYEAGTMNFVIKEVIPQDATQSEDGVWTKDGVTYDATEHYVRVVTTDDNEGQLHAEVFYDNDTAIPTFTNTYFGATASIELNKEYYGANNTAAFQFELTAANDEFEARAAGDSGVVSYDAASVAQGVVDFGQAFTITQTNGSFKDHVAKVVMPAITYYEPGTYRYLASEVASGQSQGLLADDATVLVTVEVNKDAKTRVTYQTSVGGQAIGTPSENVPTFYNNEMVSMAFRSRALRQMAGQERVVSFEPAVKKVLQNGVLKGDDFKFAIYAGTEAQGNALQTVGNDVNGVVSFNMLKFDESSLQKTFDYTIVELPSTDETVVTDTHAIRLSVRVSEGEEGQLVAEGTYSDVAENGTLTTTDDPTFVNKYDTIVIHAVKRSREEPYDPLPGAHYGLWMVNPSGEDVYMGLGRNQLEAEGSELVSSQNGDLYYDIPLTEGVAYYFLEEWPPPAGHLVDPYPTDYFTLVHDKQKGTFRLVYEADSDFSKYCPGVSR